LKRTKDQSSVFMREQIAKYLVKILGKMHKCNFYYICFFKKNT